MTALHVVVDSLHISHNYPKHFATPMLRNISISTISLLPLGIQPVMYHTVSGDSVTRPKHAFLKPGVFFGEWNVVSRSHFFPSSDLLSSIVIEIGIRNSVHEATIGLGLFGAESGMFGHYSVGE